jgi:hypothetical protein
MEKCERCNDIHAPLAEYTLQKRGYTRQVILCKACRDVTAQVYPLKAVKPEPVIEAKPDEAPEAQSEPETPAEESPDEPRPRRGRPRAPR